MGHKDPAHLPPVPLKSQGLDYVGFIRKSSTFKRKTLIENEPSSLSSLGYKGKGWEKELNSSKCLHASGHTMLWSQETAKSVCILEGRPEADTSKEVQHNY